MTDHKFEPGQLVLVRNSDEHKWRLLHYSHFRNSADEHFFATIGERDYRYCLPFNDDTKHLQNTTLPYGPPKPPVEYEWGDKVEVNQGDSKWKIAIYIGPARDPDEHWCTKKESPHALSALKIANIRPIHDDTAAH